MSESGSPAPVAVVAESPVVAPTATVTAAPQIALTTSYSLPYTYTYVPAEGSVPQQQYYYSYPTAQGGAVYYQPYYGGYNLSPEVAPATKAVQKKKGCCGGAPVPKAPIADVNDIAAGSISANIAPVEISKAPSVVPAAAAPSVIPGGATPALASGTPCIVPGSVTPAPATATPALAAATPAPIYGNDYGYATSYEIVQGTDGCYYYVPVAPEPAKKAAKKKSCWC